MNRSFIIVILVSVLFQVTSTANTVIADKVMVLDFELKDLTLYENNKHELQRTAKLRALLEQELPNNAAIKVIDFDSELQLQADHGVGYLYDRPELVASLGSNLNADWVVVGRVHKPSYLFVYLKVQLINVKTKSMAADLTVEMKGQQEKFIKKSITRLALQIIEAIDFYKQ